MLVTYDRYLREYKRGKPGALLTYKACPENGLWCNVCRKVAASMDALGKALAIALFSLVFITGCTSAYTYTTERCPAPLTAQGCYAHLEKK